MWMALWKPFKTSMSGCPTSGRLCQKWGFMLSLNVLPVRMIESRRDTELGRFNAKFTRRRDPLGID